MEFRTALMGLRILADEHAQHTENETRVTTTANEPDELTRGQLFSALGPAPYVGNILESPDLVWADDEWDSSCVEDAERRLLEQGSVKQTEFWRNEYTTSANKYWHKFYKRNKDNFYKDRHYIHLVYKEVLSSPNPASSPDGYFHLLEVGCGVGNAVLPLLELNPHLYVHAVDFARSAVEILAANPLIESSGQRLRADVCDVVNDCIPGVTHGQIDGVMCMFVLSAIAPESQRRVLRKLADTLKPGGTLFIRDYGRYDEAQLRFKKGAKLEDNFYVRQDGTCSFFFLLEELVAMGEGLRRLDDDDEAGEPAAATATVDTTDAPGGGVNQGDHLLRAVPEECFYIHRQYANRSQRVARRRVWIQAKFVKM
jgi:methyltransferase-like protein 6